MTTYNDEVYFRQVRKTAANRNARLEADKQQALDVGRGITFPSGTSGFVLDRVNNEAICFTTGDAWVDPLPSGGIEFSVMVDGQYQTFNGGRYTFAPRHWFDSHD